MQGRTSLGRVASFSKNRLAGEFFSLERLLFGTGNDFSPVGGTIAASNVLQRNYIGILVLRLPIMVIPLPRVRVYVGVAIQQ